MSCSNPTSTCTASNPKPVWLTEELSQEWIDEQHQHPSSLRIPSSSRIPLPQNRYFSASSLNSLIQNHHHHQSTSISSLNLPQPTVPSPPSFNPSNSQVIHSSPSLRTSDPSIILNSDDPADHHTPPWLRAAVDGMVNQVLGKKPTQLEKIFQNSSSPPLPSQQQDTEKQTHQDQEQHPPPTSSNLLHPNQPAVHSKPSIPATSSHGSCNRIPSSSIYPSSAEQSASFLPNVQFQFSVPRSHAPLISFEDSLQESIQQDPSPQSIIEYQADEQDEHQQLHPYLSVPIPGCNMERLRFTRDTRLDEIVEVTEPSSSVRISAKSNQSRASSSNFGSLPSSFNPPSLPFAHRTPVIGLNGRIHRIKSDTHPSPQSSHTKSHQPNPQSACNSSDKRCDIPSCDRSDLSNSQTRFRFTYDTFTRKHLNRLTQEIHGLSLSEASALRSDAPLKIKSILGSPGEEVTDSSTSIGLAHSTPPVTMHPSSNHQQRIFHAGRTPFRLITSLSERLREEKQWTESFVEPSTYAIESLSPVVERKSYRDQRDHEELQSRDLNQPDIQTGSHSCRSSKRIRLESVQSDSSQTRHSRLRESVALMNERNHRRRTPTFTRVHPMVVFKDGTGTGTSNTPQEKPAASQTVVRDRLAEAKALMDRIRAKTTPAQAKLVDPPQLKKKLSGHQNGITHEQVPHASNPPVEKRSSAHGAEDTASSIKTSDLEFLQEDNDASWHNPTDGCVRKHPEPVLEWDISIEEDLQDNRDKEENEEEYKESPILSGNGKVSIASNRLATSNPLDSVHQRLASTAAAFLRQTLGDGNCHHHDGHEKLVQQQHRSSIASTSTNLAGTTASRRQFATQSTFREPVGRVTHDAYNHFARSNSTVACTSVSAPTPALTVATSTRQSSTSSHSHHQGFEVSGKQSHNQKLGLMTIAPCDVEDLLQNRRVGNMVFDSTIGKWVKVRSQSETGGIMTRIVEDESANLQAVGETGTQPEDSTDEEDIFKDIESLNSKRESDSSGSVFLADVDFNLQTNLNATGNTSDSEKNQPKPLSVEAEKTQDANSNKKISIVKSEKSKPKSVLKTSSESPSEKSSAVMIPDSIEKSHLGIGALKPGRSVSFQDGRKNGKIIGLADANIAEDDDQVENPGEVIKEQQKTLKETNMNELNVSRKSRKPPAAVETKGSKHSSYQNPSLHDQNSPVASENSFHQNENSHSLLNQTSLVLINSAKKKVRRKSSSSNMTGTTNSNNNSLINTPVQNRSPPFNQNNNHNNLSTINSNSNHLIYDSNSNNNLISEYSFELNYSKLIKIITDFEPFEPFWNSIKVINLSNKSIDSVIRLNEILPLLDQIDLSSNQLNYLTGLPSTLRMLIASKNQLNEMCSFNHLQDLVRLDLSQNALTSLQPLSCLKHLRELKADENLITDFTGADQLDSLVKLSLKGNRIKKINFESTNWDHLEVLNLDQNQICELTGLHFLKSVYLLNLDRNQIYSLTLQHTMPNLRVLRINENRLESLDVSKLINLRTLYIDNNDLMEISGASLLKKLENLSVRDQRGGELSLPLKQVRDVKRIYLGGNPLPAAFPTSQFYNLTYLELAMCQCQSLPPDLANLIPNIRTINLNYNFLKDLSPLKNLKRLERLTLVGSRIKALDTNLLNVLESLPELELLDLRQNPLCASFYPPLLLKTTPSTSIVQSGTAPHLNQYQIVVKEHEDDWQAIDDRFRKSLPNEFYLKRMTYRSIIMKTCNHRSFKLKCLDGIKINEGERKKMDKFLRGLSRKLDQKNQSTSSSLNPNTRRVEEEEVEEEVVAEEIQVQPLDHRHSKKLPSSSNLDHVQQPAQVIVNRTSNNNNPRRSRDHKPSSRMDISTDLAVIDRSRF